MTGLICDGGDPSDAATASSTAEGVVGSVVEAEAVLLVGGVEQIWKKVSVINFSSRARPK